MSWVGKGSRERRTEDDDIREKESGSITAILLESEEGACEKMRQGPSDTLPISLGISLVGNGLVDEHKSD